MLLLEWCRRLPGGRRIPLLSIVLVLLVTTGHLVMSSGGADATPSAVPAAGSTPRTERLRPASTAAVDRSWHLGWRAESVFPAVSLATTTCRFSARLTVTGTAVRAEFTSAGGGRGYRILAASVARPVAPHALEVDVATSRPLHFGGSDAVQVGADAAVTSDPTDMSVAAGDDLLVTVTASAGDAYTKLDLAEPGGCTTATPADPATAPATALTEQGRVRWLHSLLVDGPAVRSVAALGDSLTEGPASPDFAYVRWSDRLVGPGVAVANAGVAGNALSRYGMFGTPNGETRAQALLAEPGLNDVVMILGTNDLVLGQSSDQILDGIGRVAEMARTRGVALWVGTILPRGASRSSDIEQARETVNAALLNGRFSAAGVHVLDTASSVADPADSHDLDAGWDGGDHLHLNRAGARVLGTFIRQAMGLHGSDTA